MRSIKNNCDIRQKLVKYLASFSVPVCFYLIFLALSDIYPFGDVSITRDDLFYQYIDFFSYLKNVFDGTLCYEHTFSQSIGSSPVALIGYYLFSPLNILVVFFEKSQLELFIFLITGLKIGFAGLFFSLFISNRFNLSFLQIQALTVAYTFTQYMVGQMSNIMWLDGVYMLPLLLFAVYRFIKHRKHGLFLVTVTMTVVFNWYTGYMNCIFVVLYYLYESVVCGKIKAERDSLKRFVIDSFVFLCTEGAGVLLSCVVFLPIVLGQAQGRVFDEGILEFGTNGNFGDIFRGFIIGSDVPGREITLFCSILVLVFFFAYWFCKGIKTRQKVASAVLVGFMTCSMFFAPLEAIWVGFKYEASYVYRFAYIAIFTVIFISAFMMDEMKKVDRKDRNSAILYGSIFFVVFLVVLDTIESFDRDSLWLQIALIFIYAILFFIVNAVKSDKNLFSVRAKKGISIALSGVFVLVFGYEVVINSLAVAGKAYPFSQSEYESYVIEQEKLVDRVHEYDGSFYRMEQTSNRSNSIVVSNEPLVYGYRGVQTYTSSYNEDSSLLLRNLGYHIRVYPSVYLDSILPVDSFLGIKYLMSPSSEIIGYEKTNIEGGNGKSVYYNPYALPFMFNINGVVEKSDSFENSFEYVNAIYSAILGKNVEIFKSVEISDVDVLTDGSLEYTFEGQFNNQYLYCSFGNKTMKRSAISLNGEECITYSNGAWGMWENVRFVTIINGEQNVVNICNPSTDKENVKAYFYSFDVENFERIVDEIRGKSAELLVFEDEYVEAKYEAEADGKLLFTIPYDEAWTVIVNGEEVECEEWADSLLCIPVTEGENTIVMNYSARGKVAGLVISIITFLGIVALFFFNRKFRYFPENILLKSR